MKLKIKEQKINQVFHPIQIKDRTVIQRYLPTRISTSLAMYRKALK